MKKERLYSVFDIAGKNENGLTQSFGTLLRKDKTLLNKLVQLVIPGGIKINNELFQETDFQFEKSSSEGRTDIAIENEEIHLIIESKIGTNRVKIDQAERYCKILEKSKARKKCFIFLTEIGNLDIDERLRKRHKSIRFANLSWNDTLELLRSRRQISVNLVREYENYILEAHQMKIYDIDIWAVSVRGEQIKNFDKHNFYINNKRHSPILIGKREWDPKLKKVVIRELKPVLNILDKGKLKKYKNDYVYQLGPSLKLQKPIIRKFGQASAIALKFDQVKMGK